ncbi:MAG: universal stress protein [Saccharospirillum sp.]|nr:universal stress protein [Saccharospirillum sp.]
MVKTFIVGFDGTDACQRAMDFAVACAKHQSATLHLVHVLEWSPYKFMSHDEMRERHERKKQEVASAEKFIEPVVEKMRSAGIEITSEVRYGNPTEIICEIAKKKPDSQIFVGRKGASKLTKLLVGSVGMSLIQSSPVPVTIVP